MFEESTDIFGLDMGQLTPLYINLQFFETRINKKEQMTMTLKTFTCQQNLRSDFLFEPVFNKIPPASKGTN